MITTLGTLDLIVLGLSLVATVVIGLFASRQTKTVESYLLGDRDLPWWAILGSIVATETSTATVLSVPGEAYGPTGMKFLQLALGYMLGRTVVVQLLLPLYFKGQLFTAYQVLDKRFGETTKKAASLLFLVTRNLGDGLRLYLAALVLHTLVDWSFGWSVLAMGIVTILYTCFGGLRSVVWNDCLQLVIYMVGAVVSVFVIADQIPGGWAALWDFAEAHDKLRIVNPSFSFSETYTIWAGLLGGAILTLGTHGTDHMMVQRYLSARSQRDAGRAILLSGVVVFVQFSVFLFLGVELACFYAGYPDVTFDRSDQVFAHFMVHHFPKNVGLIGLMLAAIFSAAMSTLSSSLNASASALLNDFYLPPCKEPPSPAAQLSLSRWLTVLFGAIQMAIGYFAKDLPGTVVSNALTIAGYSAGLLLGVFALGVFTRRVGQSAALTGAAAGLMVLSGISFGLNAPKATVIAWPWFALIGATTTLLVGYAASYLYSPPSRPIDVATDSTSP